MPAAVAFSGFRALVFLAPVSPSASLSRSSFKFSSTLLHTKSLISVLTAYSFNCIIFSDMFPASSRMKLRLLHSTRSAGTCLFFCPDFLFAKNSVPYRKFRDSCGKKFSTKYNRPPKGQFMSAFRGRLKHFFLIFSLPFSLLSH